MTTAYVVGSQSKLHVDGSYKKVIASMMGKHCFKSERNYEEG